MLENTQIILADIHMLATDKAVFPYCLWLGRISGQLHLDHSYPEGKTIDPIDNSMLPQFLYATTNEKIKEGDWYIWLNKLYQAVPLTIKQGQAKNPIVATTDPELWWKLNIMGTKSATQDVPKIPTSFIEVFIKAWNTNKPITQVLLETEGSNEDLQRQLIGIPLLRRLKLRDDRSVIIHPVVEPKYSFEQLVDAILCNSSMTIQEAKDYVNNLPTLKTNNYERKRICSTTNSTLL